MATFRISWQRADVKGEVYVCGHLDSRTALARLIQLFRNGGGPVTIVAIETEGEATGG